MPTEPLIVWPKPLVELLGFLALFLSAGALGFRYVVARRLLGASAVTTAREIRHVHDAATTRAAMLGLVGALLGALLLASRLPEIAARRHVTVTELLMGNGPLAAQVVMVLVTIAGFSLALGRRAPGWPLAAFGVVAGTLRAAFLGQWARLVNPIHELAAGMWIGTLFVLVAAGLSTVLRGESAAEHRGVIAAEMVHAFSPLALASAAVVAAFGAITAWRHLEVLSALWSTPYGLALIAKLCVVAVVVALGAWNWRHQRPRLGSEDAALALRRSARAELGAAAVVLAITAILVSLPDPKPPVR